MKVFKYLFFALLFLLVVFFAYGYFVLEDKVQVKRSISIDRPAKMVYKNINSMHTFNQWSPWVEEDPNAKYEYAGPETGVGSKMAWQGNQKVGAGSQEIIEVVENQMVKTELYFDGQGDDPSWATLAITDQGDSVTIDWIYNTDFKGNVLGRYFGMMMDDMLGPQYEKGLKKLKSLVEAQKVYDFSMISVEDVPAQTILYVSAEANTNQDVSPVLAQAYGQIMQILADNQLEQAGMPLAITRSWDAGNWVFDAAIPVDVDGIELPQDSAVKLGSTQAGKVVKYIQKGNYDQAEVSYETIDAYLKDQNLEKNGDSWEVYANDPSTVATEDIETHIFHPVK